MSVDVAAADRHCEQITRSEAANFFYGMRLLPPAKRRAMFSIYAFARRVDDIGDGSWPIEDKLAGLAAVRTGLAEDLDPGSADPVLAALATTCRRFPLPLDALTDLVDGVEMDVEGHRYQTWDDLVTYCRRVAGSVGRLSTAVFEPSQPQTAFVLADDLGVAMQLTNILRDIREDGANGRVYLPAEDLRRFGCAPDPARAEPDALCALVHFEAARNREWFARGLRLLPLLDGRSASCVAAMTGIYRRLLERIDEQPRAVLARRVSLPAWEKVWVAALSLTGRRRA